MKEFMLGINPTAAPNVTRNSQPIVNGENMRSGTALHYRLNSNVPTAQRHLVIKEDCFYMNDTSMMIQTTNHTTALIVERNLEGVTI